MDEERLKDVPVRLPGGVDQVRQQAWNLRSHGGGGEAVADEDLQGAEIGPGDAVAGLG
jgi:hypothetical protein